MSVQKENWIFVCNVDDIKQNESFKTVINERNIAIWKLEKEGIICLDANCAHAGGHLYEGEIEDFDDRTILRCPSHAWAFCVKTGERLRYNSEGQLCNDGKKQRVHLTKIENGKIFVSILNTKDKQRPQDLPKDQKVDIEYEYLMSDFYAYRKDE